MHHNIYVNILYCCRESFPFSSFYPQWIVECFEKFCSDCICFFLQAVLKRVKSTKVLGGKDTGDIKTPWRYKPSVYSTMSLLDPLGLELMATYCSILFFVTGWNIVMFSAIAIQYLDDIQRVAVLTNGHRKIRYTDTIIFIYF